MRINKNSQNVRLLLYMGILLSVFLFSYQVTAVGYDDTNDQGRSSEQQPTHEQIIDLTNQFMEKLVQEIDGDNQVVQYHTKESLKASFDEIADRKITDEYIDYYYYEDENNGLYIVPTELPPWFIENNKYDVVQLSGNQVKVVQDNQAELYGDYTIEIELTLDVNEKWKISNVVIV